MFRLCHPFHCNYICVCFENMHILCKKKYNYLLFEHTYLHKRRDNLFVFSTDYLLNSSMVIQSYNLLLNLWQMYIYFPYICNVHIIYNTQKKEHIKINWHKKRINYYAHKVKDKLNRICIKYMNEYKHWKDKSEKNIIIALKRDEQNKMFLILCCSWAYKTTQEK